MTTTYFPIVLTVPPSLCSIRDAVNQKTAAPSPPLHRRTPQICPSNRCERYGNVAGGTARLRLGSPRYIRRTFATSHSAAFDEKERVLVDPKRGLKAVRTASIHSL